MLGKIKVKIYLSFSSVSSAALGASTFSSWCFGSGTLFPPTFTEKVIKNEHDVTLYTRQQVGDKISSCKITLPQQGNQPNQN